MIKKYKVIASLILLAAASSSAFASVDKYSTKCEEESTDIYARAKCLNGNGYNLLVVAKKIPEGQSIKGKSWFKLYSIDGKDITPSISMQDKHFKGSLPTYTLVNKEIHQFGTLGEFGEGDDEPEDLCISAKTGKKVKCKY
jgi:hypothetical protein